MEALRQLSYLYGLPALDADVRQQLGGPKSPFREASGLTFFWFFLVSCWIFFSSFLLTIFLFFFCFLLEMGFFLVFSLLRYLLEDFGPFSVVFLFFKGIPEGFFGVLWIFLGIFVKGISMDF